MPFHFEVLKTDPSGARLGRLTTPHGVIETPAFMPVGTAGTVKGLTQQALEDLGVGILLANTYHLYLRPGHELIARMGGLHQFMAWRGGILTDSGGFQVLSLADLRQVSDEGVRFRSHLDGGSLHLLTPEKAIEIQQALGSDIGMLLDECIAAPSHHNGDREGDREGAPEDAREGTPEAAHEATREAAHAAAARTLLWARRSRAALDNGAPPSACNPEQVFFAIVQGGTYADLRRENAQALVELDFPGYAIGGLAVGEPHELSCEMATAAAEFLPEERPRYLMGVGKPEQLADYVRCGIDMMDCVLPTRNARNGCLYTRQGPLHIKNARYAADARPPDEACACMVCRRYSRAYLRHLFQADEILAAILNSHHNVYFYLDLMRAIREAIAFGNLSRFSSELHARMEAGQP
jgi:queuine tRNA-ribosyltransferase